MDVLADPTRDEALVFRRQSIAMILLYLLALYVLIGFVTAIAFVSVGLPRVLPHGMTASCGARILFVPGATALWPLVLSRWLKARRAA